MILYVILERIYGATDDDVYLRMVSPYWVGGGVHGTRSDAEMSREYLQTIFTSRSGVDGEGKYRIAELKI